MQEQLLFKSVLVQGLTDALGKFLWPSRLNVKYQREAIDWLEIKDFDLVCSYANWQPNEIMKIYKDINKHTHYLTVTDIRYLLYETITRRS